MMEPLASVVLATYRRENELQRALESLTGQTECRFEIILVDDNGNREWNERVERVAGAFRAAHPDIALRLIVNSPNLGSARARNEGIAAASGEYITFLDDDDEYLPEKIASQLRFMQAEGLDYSLTDLELYYEDGRLCERRKRSYLKDMDREALLANHLMHHMTGTDTMMFRREYLVRIGGFDPIDVGDEFYLMVKAIDAGGKFGHLGRCDVRAYVHTDDAGLSSGDGKIRGENALYEYKKKYFSRLAKSQIRYIRTRHHAVIAFAELRRKRYGACLAAMIRAAVCSPADCLRIILTR